MIEKLKEINFLNISEEVVNDLITELVKLPKEELKECVVHIIDNCPDTEDFNPNLSSLFETDEVRTILDELMSEYDND